MRIQFQGHPNKWPVTISLQLACIPLFVGVILTLLAVSPNFPQNLLTGGDGNYADQGSSSFKDQIFWLTWENGDLADGIHENDSKTFTIPGGLEVTATFTNVTEDSDAFTPYDFETWHGSISHGYYQISGSAGEALYGGNNKTADFTLSFSATLAGVPYAPHIVFLDSESTDSGESIQVTTSGDDWQVIETLGSGQVQYVFPSGKTCDITHGSQGNPVLLSKYASSLEVYADGSGKQGVSFGIWFGFDYGDAPDSYATSDGLGGAKHVVDKSNLLCLGSKIDAETDGPSVGTGAYDNGAGIDDEEGITLPTFFQLNTSYILPTSDVLFTNQLLTSATLHAWIDFDQSGTFDTDEYASTTVAANTALGHPNSDLIWTGISGSQAGNTYARFRLSTDASLSASTPGGMAHNGEVEDYLVLIADATLGQAPFHLEVHPRKDHALLEWKASPLFETAFFQIEKSINLRPEFIPIGKTRARHRELKDPKFSFKDVITGTKGQQEKVAYRVGRVDMAGGIYYSNIVELEPHIDIFHFEVGPNPAKDVLRVSFHGLHQETGKLLITNPMGQRLYERWIGFNQKHLTLDLAAWPRGRYIVQVISKHRSEGKAIVLE